MKKDLVELVFIIDKSGSMHSLESDTIGGFNSMIDEQKSKNIEMYVSSVLFNQGTEILHDRVAIDAIEHLTDKQYVTAGMTALLDAIGNTITRIKNTHQTLPEDDVPEHTMFFITTDGMENASREYTFEIIKNMINEQKKYNWEFIFVAANIDAIETAADIGISRDRAANYNPTSMGIQSVFNAFCCCLNREISTRKYSACEPFGEDWKDKLK